MNKIAFDPNNLNQQLIMAGITGLVDEGLSPREAFIVVESIKRNTFQALNEIRSEQHDTK